MSEDEIMRNKGGSALMTKQETERFRGIAVVMVILSHYAEWWTWFLPTEGVMEIFRQGLAKLGIYGVDLFFLFSGYAMVKSLGQERMHPQFIWKRIKNVYIPYLIVIGIIELISGGFTSVQDFWIYVSGYDYWYMFVLFVFYIGFIAVYTIIGGRAPRVIVFSIFTYVFSYILYDRGMYDFWYVSNIAFALGVIVGEYEKTLKKLVDKIGIPLIILLTAGMGFAVYYGLLSEGWKLQKTPRELLLLQIGATVIWTVLGMLLVSKCAGCRIKEKVFPFLGKNSLYIYLTHTYIFMRCVNGIEASFPLRFIISAVLTVLVSFLLNMMITKVEKLILRS